MIFYQKIFENFYDNFYTITIFLKSFFSNNNKNISNKFFESKNYFLYNKIYFQRTRAA